MPFPNIDPVIFQLGPLAVRWYSLAYIAGILGGLYAIVFLLKQRRLWSEAVPAPEERHFHDFILWAVLAVIIGGRLGEVLFYHPAYFFNHPLEIFAIWKGGMSFHGGFIGVVLAGILFTQKRDISFWTFSDLWCAVAPLGLFLGRIANFINGELWGRVSDVPWAIIFPRAGPFPRHPSQLYEALLEGLLLFLFLQAAIFYGKAFGRPGALIGLFLMGYGVARTIAEFFREPDGIVVGALTLGMALSLPMIVAGGFVFFYARKTA